MKRLSVLFLLYCAFACAEPPRSGVDHAGVRADLDQIIDDLTAHYAYLADKNVDLDCVRAHYGGRVEDLRTEAQTVLFFEYLLDEFYDSHLILNANTRSSYRLNSPLYVSLRDGRPLVTNVWQTRLSGLDTEILGAEVLALNGTPFAAAIDSFPTHCSDKRAPPVREWIANKIVAGRYDRPRVLTLRLTSGETTELDIDQLKMAETTGRLASAVVDGVGIITVHNTLGDNELIGDFDRALDSLMNTRGLILDLRNTVDGGNTYVARGIMGRFVDGAKPYQKHALVERYDGGPPVRRSWVEYVSPRGKRYAHPLVVLVGRWTGSMGEGLAVGFAGAGRARVVGSEMERLAGEVNGFSFGHQDFGYSLSTARLFHVDGTPREAYVPDDYVTQSTVGEDETLAAGLTLIKEATGPAAPR